MDKVKNYYIGFLIIYTFEICMEIGFIVRLGLSFAHFDIFGVMLLIPTLLLIAILVVDTIFFVKWQKEINTRKDESEKYKAAFLAVKEKSKRSLWNTDLVFQWGSCGFMILIGFIGLVPFVFMMIGWNAMKESLKATKCKNDSNLMKENNMLDTA